MNSRVWILFCILVCQTRLESPAYSSTTRPAALPLRLVLFTASTTAYDVLLKWTTEYEENVNKFVIEKTDGVAPLVPVGEVVARNIPSSYSFSIRIYEPSYFRLRMIDIDGRSTNSNILSVRPGINPGDFSLLTNPVTEGVARITIYSIGEADGEFVLHDIAGRLKKKIITHLSKGTNFITLPVNELIAGIYLLRYRDNKQQTIAVKLVKLN